MQQLKHCLLHPLEDEHTGQQRRPHRSSVMIEFFGGGGSQEHMPVLQQVLGVLDLVLCSCDGDDAVLRAL